MKNPRFSGISGLVFMFVRHARFFASLCLFIVLASCSSTATLEERLETSSEPASLILFYKWEDGSAKLKVVDSTGQLTTLKDYPARSFGRWTRFYATQWGLIPYNWRSWTHIVHTPTGVFFYDSGDGAAAFGTFDASGNFTQVKSYPPGSFSTDWSHIVTTANGVLFYGSAEVPSFRYANPYLNYFAFGTFDASGNFTQLNSFTETSAERWSHVVNTPTGAFFYDNTDGSGAFGTFDVNGNFSKLKSYPLDAFRNAFMYWSHVVDTPTGVFFYDWGQYFSGNCVGCGAFGTFDATGNFTNLKTYPQYSFSAFFGTRLCSSPSGLLFHIIGGSTTWIDVGRFTSSGDYINLWGMAQLPWEDWVPIFYVGTLP